jgi:methionyl-tRNA formyltransferase
MRIVFAGTPANAAQALRLISQQHQVDLVLTREDAPVGRKRVMTQSAVALVAHELGLKVHKANRITTTELAALQAAEAELGVVVAYGCIMPQDALDIFPWWNMHFSLLPKWRGATPLQRSIASGGDGSGVTIFELDKGMDTGPIISQRGLEIRPSESTLRALPRFTSFGTELLLDAMQNRPEPIAQLGDPSFAPKISRAEGRVDFNLPAQKIASLIAAFNPEPSAWAELAGSSIRIIEAVSSSNQEALAQDLLPGQIAVLAKRVIVGCGQGVLELISVQPAGKNQMRAADWQRGLNEGAAFD